MKTTDAILGAVTALLISLGPVAADEAVAPAEKDAETASKAETALDAKWASATVEQLREEINRIGELARQKISESATLQQRIGTSAADQTFTSEAIEKKRLEVKKLEKALIQARIELQEEVAKHPDVAALAQKNQAILVEVDQLRKMKKALMQRLTERLAEKGGGQGQ